MTASGERYAAFISYSHTDEKAARWLHRWLESYSVPKAFRGRRGPAGLIANRIGKVFRDREEFAAGGELKAEIETALDRSDALIVLCSPAAAASRHVNAEAEYFKARGGRQIIPVFLSGEYPSCQPQALCDGVDRLGADFRKGGDGRDMGALKVVSGLLGVRLDDLIQRDAAARRGRLRAKIGVISLLAVLGMLATVFGTLAYRNVMRAREIHASRLQEETDFLVGQALSTTDPTTAVKSALQALPMDFANPERPFSPRALVALQGALFHSTLVARASSTESTIVDMVLIEAMRMALVATAEGQLLRFDTDDFDAPRPIGRCAGTPERLQVLHAARVVVLSTDSAVCGWIYSDDALTALPVLNQSGDVTLQSDRILVSGSSLSAYYYAERKWRASTEPAPTPGTARGLGNGVIAFDHGSHFHLIDAFTRQNLFVGCLGNTDCPSSVTDYQAVEVNHDRTRFVLYGQGVKFIDFVMSKNCTTEGEAYSGNCESTYSRVPAKGENTVGVTFTPSTYVRDEFAGGYEIGNANSGGLFYQVSGRSLTERSLSRDGRFLAVYEPRMSAQDGGTIIDVHDLLSPEAFTRLTVAEGVKQVDLGETGRLALVLEQSGRLTLHSAVGRSFSQERRWPMQDPQHAPYTFALGDEAVGVVSPEGVRLIDVDDVGRERLIALNGSKFLSAEFRNRDAGCVASTDEIVCIANGSERRLPVTGQGNPLAALSADAAYVVTQGHGRLELYAVDGPRRLWSSPAESTDYCCVHFSASGKTLLVSYRDGTWVGFDAANGKRRHAVGVASEVYGPRAINRARTQFVARIEGDRYGIFNIDNGNRIQEFTITSSAQGSDAGEVQQELAIDADFTRIWYVQRPGQGVVRSLRDGSEVTIDVAPDALGSASFAPSGRYIVRESDLRIGAGAMVMPEAMEIVDVARRRAYGRTIGHWSPGVKDGVLDTDALIARSYSLGLETLSLPQMAGGKDEMRVKVGNQRQHARLALMGLEDGAPFGVQSVEFSLELHALQMFKSKDRLLMIAVDRASNEFVLRTYALSGRCDALRAEGEALLGRRPSSPSADNDAQAPLGRLEQAFSALLGPQQFEPAACEGQRAKN